MAGLALAIPSTHHAIVDRDPLSTASGQLVEQYLTHLRGGENTAALELTTAGTSFREGAGSSLPETGDVGSSTIADFTLTSVRPAPGSGVFDSGDPHVVTAEIDFDLPDYSRHAPGPQPVEFTVVRLDPKSGTPSRLSDTRFLADAPLFHTVEFALPAVLPDFTESPVVEAPGPADLAIDIATPSLLLPPAEYSYTAGAIGTYLALEPVESSLAGTGLTTAFTVDLDGAVRGDVPRTTVEDPRELGLVGTRVLLPALEQHIIDHVHACAEGPGSGDAEAGDRRAGCAILDEEIEVTGTRHTLSDVEIGFIDVLPSNSNTEPVIIGATSRDVTVEFGHPFRILVSGSLPGTDEDVFASIDASGLDTVFTVTENEVTADWSCVDVPADEECP